MTDRQRSGQSRCDGRRLKLKANRSTEPAFQLPTLGLPRDVRNWMALVVRALSSSPWGAHSATFQQVGYKAVHVWAAEHGKVQGLRCAVLDCGARLAAEVLPSDAI